MLPPQCSELFSGGRPGQKEKLPKNKLAAALLPLSAIMRLILLIGSQLGGRAISPKQTAVDNEIKVSSTKNSHPSSTARMALGNVTHQAGYLSRAMGRPHLDAPHRAGDEM